MRIAFLSFIIGLFFIGITYYFFVEVSPFDESKLQEIIEANKLEPGEEDSLYFELDFIIERGLVFEYLSINAYVGFISFIISLTLFFNTVHVIIDKLFYKELIEPPDFRLAMRRDIEFAIGCVTFLLLKLKGIDVEVAALTFVIVVGIDFFIGTYASNRKEPQDRDHFAVNRGL